VTKSAVSAEPCGQAVPTVIGEIEIVDRIKKGKVGTPRESGQPRLVAVCNHLRRELRKEIVVSARLALGRSKS